jgi:hypothetical protein
MTEYRCLCNDGAHPESDYQEIHGKRVCMWCLREVITLEEFAQGIEPQPWTCPVPGEIPGDVGLLRI